MWTATLHAVLSCVILRATSARKKKPYVNKPEHRIACRCHSLFLCVTFLAFLSLFAVSFAVSLSLVSALAVSLVSPFPRVSSLPLFYHSLFYLFYWWCLFFSFRFILSFLFFLSFFPSLFFPLFSVCERKLLTVAVQIAVLISHTCICPWEMQCPEKDDYREKRKKNKRRERRTER